MPAVVGPGPDNPLGDYKIRLGFGNGTYEIHGTNNPTAVGLAITHGCIRMYPEDVAALFPQLPVGTPVRLINVPVKVAWIEGELLLEAHPPVNAQGESFEPDVDQKIPRHLARMGTRSSSFLPLNADINSRGRSAHEHFRLACNENPCARDCPANRTARKSIYESNHS